MSFQDDIFGLDRGWLSGFLEEYKKKVRTPFYCLLRCDIIDEGLVDCLKDAGCFEVGIGVESGDEGVRNGILKKNLSNRYIRNAVRVLREKGVRFHTFNMLGLPSENYELALKTLLFNIELQPDVAYTSLFQPYPGTCYFNEDVRRDVINPGFSRFKINHPYSRDYRRIQRLQKFFMLTLKYPLIRFLLPILTRLPLDGLYDRVSKLSWRYIYFKRITNR